MTSYLMLVVCLLYFAIAIGYYINGNIGLSIAFFCYSLANIGLYISGNKI